MTLLSILLEANRFQRGIKCDTLKTFLSFLFSLFLYFLKAYQLLRNQGLEGGSVRTAAACQLLNVIAIT